MPVIFQSAAPIPNLPTQQSALQLDSGECFIVEITNASIPAPNDSVHWVSLLVRAWQVDTTGKVVLRTDTGAQVVVPTFTHSVPLAALADGQTTLADIVAQITAKAAEHFRNTITAIRVLQSIPKSVDVLGEAQAISSGVSQTPSTQ